MKKILLKQKVAISLIIISIVSLILISVVVFLFIHQTLIDNKKIENLAVTTEQIHESILTFKMNQLFVHMLSTRNQVKEFLLTQTEPKRAELLNIFLDYSNKESKYLAIYLLDKNGVGLISTDPRFVGQNYSFRDYFKKALNDGQPSIDVAIGVTSNQLGYYFAEPVFGDKGDILGIMVAKVDQSDISNPILTSIASQGNVIMLTDEFGVILASTEKDRNIKSLGKLSDKEIGQLKSSDRYLGKEIIPLQYDLIEQSIRDYKNPITVNITDKEDKNSEMISLIKLNDLPFYIVTEVRLVYLNNQVLNTIYYIILLVSIILILISLSIYFSLIAFIKPLDSFRLFFANISKGDFSKKIDIETKDEFADLADNVNKMSKDLSILYNNQEQKIKERTVKLEEALEFSKKNNKLMIGRELEMINLKKEIKDLKDKLIIK